MTKSRIVLNNQRSLNMFRKDNTIRENIESTLISYSSACHQSVLISLLVV